MGLLNKEHPYKVSLCQIIEHNYMFTNFVSNLNKIIHRDLPAFKCPLISNLEYSEGFKGTKIRMEKSIKQQTNFPLIIFFEK